MPAARIALGAALLAIVGWGLNALTIWSAGGLDKSVLEGPLFALGLVSILVAYSAAGIALAPTAMGWRLLGLAAAVILGLAVALAIDAAVGAVATSDGWVWEEAGLWVAALVSAAGMWALLGRRSPGQSAPRRRLEG